MSIELVLQDILIVLSIGLLEWFARVPFRDLEGGVRAGGAFGFDGNIAEPSGYSQPWVDCSHWIGNVATERL
jgi:hypothetical protein